MTTVVFVHGTGVREPHYHAAFEQVQRALHERRPGITVMPCYWGDEHGTKLHADGASIPDYDRTRSLGGATDEDYQIALWGLLYEDPLYELRLLALNAAGGGAGGLGKRRPGDELGERVRTLQVSSELSAALQRAGVRDVWEDAQQAVTRSEAYRDALAAAPQEVGTYRTAVARAFVAQAILLCEATDIPAAIATDATLRDEVVLQLVSELGDRTRSIGGWVASKVFGVALALGAMNPVERKRGAITDASYPGAGDVLLYQARGEPIRRFIRDRVREAAERDPTVVLLAHSLGGIASVDMLVQEALEPVKVLVTVGSQAPFLYEIGALFSLGYGDPLPSHFPQWLNVYDQRDFLAYIGGKLFSDRVEDQKVDNRQPFPRSHSAYWNNMHMWDWITTRLP